jgi:hypothetical protein
MYGGEVLPAFAPWVEENCGLKIGTPDLAQTEDSMTISPPIINSEFLSSVKNFSRLSFAKWERIMHSRGETNMEVD